MPIFIGEVDSEGRFMSFFSIFERKKGVKGFPDICTRPDSAAGTTVRKRAGGSGGEGGQHSPLSAVRLAPPTRARWCVTP